MGLTVKDCTVGAVTAGTTQTLAGATAITTDITVVTTGNASDGVVLPVGAPGQLLYLKNGANAGKIYAPNLGTIDGTAGATGVALTASKTTLLACTALAAGGVSTWVTLMVSA